MRSCRGETSTLDTPLSKLFPNLFAISRPITTPDIPVIVAGSILSRYEFPILPMTSVGDAPDFEKRGAKLFKAIGSLQIIRLVIESKPADYQKVLWSPSITKSMWLGALEYSDSLEKALSIFEVTGFGDARVNGAAPPHALITLDEVVALYREGKLKCGIQVKEVASRAIFVRPDTGLMDVMKKMCENRVRRLFLLGKKGYFISDRNVLAFLFSPKALALVRDTPELWTDAKVSDIPSMRAPPVSQDDTVEDIGGMVQEGHDVFWVSDSLSLLSKWDLVMKPWESGQLRVSL